MSARRLATLLLIASAGVARADATDLGEAFAHAEAAEELRVLFAATHAAPLLHDEALCREALGDVPAALVLYRAYLAADAEAPDRAAIADRGAQLERGLRPPRPQVLRGGLHVESRPEMSLVIDGHAVGRTPWTGFVESGEHHLALTGRDLKPVEVTREVKRGTWVNVSVVVSGCARPSPE